MQLDALMRLSVPEILAGGDGSGCNEEVAESHGTSCGPKKTKEEKEAAKQAKEIAKTEKQKTNFAKYQQGLIGEKRLLGIWKNTSGEAILYKAMMAGDSHKLSDLKILLGEKKTSVTQYLKYVGNAGRRLDLWKVELNKYAGTARLVMKKAEHAAVGQVDITDKQQHAALTAVSKLISNQGLDTSFSKNVMDQFMKDAGLSTLKDVSGMVKSWTSSATTEGGTWLRKIASDYYGRPWSSEYSGKDSGANYYAKGPVDKDIQSQTLALKALASAYAQADGTAFVYRGTGVSSEQMKAIVQAKQQESEYAHIPVNALSSWSTNLNKADNFGSGVVIRREVIPEDVWFANKAMAHLFSSHQHENEWIMGSKDVALKVKVSDIWIPTKESKPPWETEGKSVLDKGFTKEHVYPEDKPTKPVEAIDPKTGVNYLDTKVSGAQGTNPGGTYKGSDGVDRYVKFYNNLGQGQGESLANSIYKDLELGAPKSTVVKAGEKEAYVSNLIDGTTLKETGTSSKDAKEVMKGFAADVLTANWDAVGSNLDNIVMKGGEAYRIDNGASFFYRAQGSLKPINTLDKITEWDKFFDASVNKHYAGLATKAGYKNADDIPDIKTQIEKIKSLRDDHGGWDKYIAKKAPYAQDKGPLAKMLETRTDLLLKKVKLMQMASTVVLHAGGPGSGRRRISELLEDKGYQRTKDGTGDAGAVYKHPETKTRIATDDRYETWRVGDKEGSGAKDLEKHLTSLDAFGRSGWDYGVKPAGSIRPRVLKGFPKSQGVGHHLTSPSMTQGKGVGHRLPNPSFTAGGPGSGRKKLKSTDEISPKKLGNIRSDPRQKSIFGPGHTKELQKTYGKIKSAEELIENESGPIARKKGKSIEQVGTQFCVRGDTIDVNLGCYPSKAKANLVKNGRSFIENDIESYADYGEPMAGSMGHAHMDTRLWFTPPSLEKRGKGNHIPADNPGEKNDKFLDVTKRKSKDTKDQRMKLLKRGGPGGLPPNIPVHTTGIAPHTASYLPGMFSSAMRRKRRNGGSFRSLNAAKI